MPASAKLLSIATANAPNVMTQTDVVRVAQALFRDRFPGIDRMLPVTCTGAASFDPDQCADPASSAF